MFYKEFSIKRAQYQVFMRRRKQTDCFRPMVSVDISDR